MTVGQRPIVLAVDADEDIFSFAHHTSFLGDGSIKTEILPHRAVKPKHNQPIALAPVKKCHFKIVFSSFFT